MNQGAQGQHLSYLTFVLSEAQVLKGLNLPYKPVSHVYYLLVLVKIEIKLSCLGDLTVHT